MFIDTVKYFQQSLSALASSMDDEEKKGVRTACEKFIKKYPKLNEKFLACHETGRECILDYFSLGKGLIPYEMIQRPHSLDISPERGNFFLPYHFYSRLKDSIISDKEYESVKKFYQLLDLNNLGQLNKLYNFQDTIILAEIFEQRSNCLRKLSKFNPRKCNSASSFSGFVHRDKSKCIIALPINSEDILLFERTLIEGFSCVNTCLAFDFANTFTKKEQL